MLWLLGLLMLLLIAVPQLIWLRLLWILPASKFGSRPNPYISHLKTKPSHMVIVLGSGGHTREMQSLLKDINPCRYAKRTYVISSGDGFSETKAQECEQLIQSRYYRTMGYAKHGHSDPSPAGTLDSTTGIWDVQVVSRARNVFQPLYTSPFSSLGCLFDCIKMLYRVTSTTIAAGPEYPDVILTNGPGTGFVVVLASIVLKFLGMAPHWKMKVVFIESWARPYQLSLTGRILLLFGACDRFFVQWKDQADRINSKIPRTRVEFQDFMLGSERVSNESMLVATHNMAAD